MINKNCNTPVITEAGFTCGYIRGNRFDRKYNPSKHLIRQPYPALALETGVLDQLQRAGVTTLRFFDGQGAEYCCSLEHFTAASEDYRPAGWPAQKRLPLTGFTARRTGAAMQLALPWAEVAR